MTLGSEKGNPKNERSMNFEYRIATIEMAYPEHVRIFKVRLRIPLLGMNEVGELRGVADEKYRGIVEHPIKISVLCPELDSKTSRITSGVC